MYSTAIVFQKTSIEICSEQGGKENFTIALKKEMCASLNKYFSRGIGFCMDALNAILR